MQRRARTDDLARLEGPALRAAIAIMRASRHRAMAAHVAELPSESAPDIQPSSLASGSAVDAGPSPQDGRNRSRTPRGPTTNAPGPSYDTPHPGASASNRAPPQVARRPRTAFFSIDGQHWWEHTDPFADNASSEANHSDNSSAYEYFMPRKLVTDPVVQHHHRRRSQAAAPTDQSDVRGETGANSQTDTDQQASAPQPGAPVGPVATSPEDPPAQSYAGILFGPLVPPTHLALPDDRPLFSLDGQTWIQTVDGHDVFLQLADIAGTAITVHWPTEKHSK